MTEAYRYDVFGTLTSIKSLNGNGVLAEAETALSRFLYAGEQLDSITGLYYLRARQYDTALGRFTQEDTYLGDGRNLYVYVRNNPLKYVDPSGHCGKGLGCTAATSKETEQDAWMSALNAGFTAPDSPAAMFGRYWGNRIAPTIKDDPAGSGADYAKGLLSFIPKDVWKYLGWEVKYPDLYSTGKMTTSFGMMAYTDWLLNYSELSGMFDMPDIGDDTSGSQLNMDLQFFAGDSSEPSISSSTELEIKDIIDKISNEYKTNGQCDSFAQELVNYLKQNNIDYEIIRIDSSYAIYSDKAGEMIGLDYHYGIKIDDMIYDNLTPNGMDFESWLEDLGLTTQPKSIIDWLPVDEILNK